MSHRARVTLKVVVWAICLAPLTLLMWRAWTGDLTANPISFVTNTLGDWTLRILLASLAMTPLRIVFGLSWPMSLRRLLGLFAFFYATLHLGTYVVLDRYFDLSGVWDDVAKRPFITLGMLAFLLMLPLAITSTKGWIRRLGRRWQVLHRLVYVSAAAACLHFIWKVKVVIGEPVYYAAILAVLLLFRLAWRFRTARARLPVAAPSSRQSTPVR